MANTKRIAKRILYAFGKGLHYIGKGVYAITKWGFRKIRIAYREHERKVAIENEIRQKELERLRRIERENYYATKGSLTAIDHRTLARRNAQAQADYLDDLGSLMWGEEPKRKRR